MNVAFDKNRNPTYIVNKHVSLPRIFFTSAHKTAELRSRKSFSELPLNATKLYGIMKWHLFPFPPPSLNATWKVRLITGNSFNTFAINYLALNGNQLQVAYRHYDLNFHFTFFLLLLSVCFIVIIQFVSTICASVEILIKVHNGSPYYFTRETCKAQETSLKMYASEKGSHFYYFLQSSVGDSFFTKINFWRSVNLL